MRVSLRVIGFLLFLIIACWSTLCQPCSKANWWSSFDSEGWSTCDEYGSQYIKGLWRNDPVNNEHPIYLLEEAKCCSIPAMYQNKPPVCQIGEWYYSLDNDAGSSYCPEGHFLHGLYRSKDKWVYNIEYGKCCRPANHPNFYGHCYWENVWTTFNHKGWSQCDDGYFLTGFKKTKGKQLYNIEEFKCCKMFQHKITMTSLANVKNHVMDNTMFTMALLAHSLGYGYSYGCRAQYVGEEFKRNGDSWEAASNGPYCSGHKSSDRLKLHYGNFKIAYKSIKFGNRLIQSLTPDVYLSGTIHNDDNTDTTVMVEREVTSIRTVTHSKTSSWSRSHELGFEITYTPPDLTGGVGGSFHYNFKYEDSSTTTDSNQKEDIKTFKISTSKKVAKNSAVTWKILLAKTRSAIPYTATVIAHFSTEMDGFLRWGGGYNGELTNFHNKYRGSLSYPTVKYRFGDANTPFYEALKTQSQQNSLPWQWNQMINKHKYAKTVINQLTDEKWYEFTLTGEFRDVVGTHADITWSKANKLSSFASDTKKKGEHVPVVHPEPPEVEVNATTGDTFGKITLTPVVTDEENLTETKENKLKAALKL